MTDTACTPTGRRCNLTIDLKAPSWSQNSQHVFNGHSNALKYLEDWLKSSRAELFRRELTSISINITFDDKGEGA